MLYENTTSFIEWVIESGTMTSRPDLALTYYPSRYNFYWFVARTRFLLACRSANGSLPDLPSLRYGQIHPGFCGSGHVWGASGTSHT